MEAAEAMAGFPPIASRSKVVIRYGGAGLLFCALGYHDGMAVTTSRDDDTATRTEYHCMRCGRLVAALCSEYAEGEDDPLA